jgi:hypothetical protein
MTDRKVLSGESAQCGRRLLAVAALRNKNRASLYLSTLVTKIRAADQIALYKKIEKTIQNGTIRDRTAFEMNENLYQLLHEVIHELGLS